MTSWNAEAYLEAIFLFPKNLLRIKKNSLTRQIPFKTSKRDKSTKEKKNKTVKEDCHSN